MSKDNISCITCDLLHSDNKCWKDAPFEYTHIDNPSGHVCGSHQEFIKDNSHNNGGDTDYYDLPDDVRCCQDIIEWRDFNFSQGNLFKAAFCMNTGRHSATNYERELNKIIWYANRELKRIRRTND